MNKGYKLLKNRVLDQGLCTYCGTCVGICPAHTLNAKSETIMDEIISISVMGVAGKR